MPNKRKSSMQGVKTEEKKVRASLASNDDVAGPAKVTEDVVADDSKEKTFDGKTSKEEDALETLNKNGPTSSTAIDSRPSDGIDPQGDNAGAAPYEGTEPEEPSSVTDIPTKLDPQPRPRGRAPAGKVWNGFDWVEEETEYKSYFETKDTEVLKTPTKLDPQPRPRGRAPAGHVWNGFDWVEEETKYKPYTETKDTEVFATHEETGKDKTETPNSTELTEGEDMTVDETSSDQMKDETEDTVEVEEAWKLSKILSITQLTKDPVKCQYSFCKVPAACLYVSTMNGAKFYTCLDCQEEDYGGWPEKPSDYPHKMTQEHMDVLAKTCSRNTSIEMPVFMLTSPSKDATPVFNSNTVTPQPDAKQQVHGAVTGNILGVTPSPAAGVPKDQGKKTAKKSEKLSKQFMAMHSKWQKQAEEMGGKGTKVIVSKPEAKKRIFELLKEAFQPMNITQIHQALKAAVPSPVLKACLDEMAFDNEVDPFANDSDDEESKGKSKGTNNIDPKQKDAFKCSLIFKAAKSSGASLYYVDYSKTENNGDGLEPYARNELLSELEKAKQDVAIMDMSIKKLGTDTTKLLSEPTNEELVGILERSEAALDEAKEQVEEAKKFQADEALKKKIKRRLADATAYWRKRRRICKDFLINLEETSDGAISMKKCLDGSGQIDIDSDEAVAKAASAFAKKKQTQLKSKSIKSTNGLTLKKSSEKGDSISLANKNFVAVTMNSLGRVERVFVDGAED